MSLIGFIGCSPQTIVTTIAASDGLPSGPPEASYCAQIPWKTFSSPVTITGTGRYYYRSDSDGTVVATPNPIRYAEVRVYNVSNNLVQCTETDGSGDFSFELPTDSQTYKVAIASRSLNSNLKASVLNKPETNQFYEISTTVVADTSKSVGNIDAPATGTLEGGAFNILDQLLNANDYLRSATSGCSSSFSGCTPFSVAPKATVYWTAGFNPGTYFNEGPVSFTLKGENIIMILGGLNGDVDNADTDHFDDSVIVHEYGHFIEDNYGTLDSPGGSHSGDGEIDARLAWAEGWADYFQTAVLNRSTYVDTIGNLSGSFSVMFDADLSTQSMDVPTASGDGIFREFSVARLLWDITNSVSAPFDEIWTSVTSSTQGFKDSTALFHNSALLMKLHSELGPSTPTNVDTAINAEDQAKTLAYYAVPLSIGGACSDTATIHATDVNDTGAFETSNQFSSNHFYDYDHPGGSVTITLSYTTGSPPADLDLYLYTTHYVYGDSSTMVGSSVNGAGASESITANIPAGHYIINVMVYTGNGLGTAATYQLKINGSIACPNP